MEEMNLDQEILQTIKCWGRGSSGELGLSTNSELQNVKSPQHLPAFVGENTVTQIACGKQHSVFLIENGLVYSSGSNAQKQLGRDGNEAFPEKLSVLETQRIVQVACGDNFTVVLNSNNQLYAFGANDCGQLGFDVCQFFAKPKKIKNALSYVRIVQIACGSNHCLALASNGQVFSWGSNEHGQLGTEIAANLNSSPTEVKALCNLPIYMIAAGGTHSFALTVSGTLFGWGSNSYGQLGLGDERDRKVPTVVQSLRSKGVTHVCCGDDHTAVLTKFGRIFTFGSGKKGQLGHGDSEVETNPKQVIELTGDKVLQIACGSFHTLALVEGSGKLYSFGRNQYGQLGTGSKSSSQRIPVLVEGQWGRYMQNTSAPFDHVMTDTHYIHKIFSGGNQNFVLIHSQQSNLVPADQRLLCLDHTTTLFLDETRINELKSQYMKGKDAEKNAIQAIATIFSSASCLNGSFLDWETHHETGLNNHGLNLKPLDDNENGFMLRKMAAMLLNVKTFFSNVLHSSLSLLLPKLVSTPADVEAFRVFLIIPEMFPGNEISKENKAIVSFMVSFGEKILNMNEETQRFLCTWWSLLPPAPFVAVVNLFKTCCKRSMELFNCADRSKNLQISLMILRLLNKINEEKNFIIPYEAFYIPSIQKIIDIRKDFLLLLHHPDAFSFCKFPFIFNAEAKTEMIKMDAEFQNALHIQRRIDESCTMNPYLVFHVRRGKYLVRDTLGRIENICKSTKILKENVLLELTKPLKVVFEGENGIDWGGPTKEFFQLLVEELFQQKYGMFKGIENSSYVWFNKQSFEDPMMYRLIGVICGLALYNSVIIDIHFPPVLYKKLLNKKTDFSDFETLDHQYARTLRYLLDYDEVEEGDVENDIGGNFQLMEEVYGQTVFVDLVADAEKKKINADNRQQYVDLVVDYFLNKSIEEQYTKFVEGFYSVCPRSLLMRVLRPNELMTIISGYEDDYYDDFMKLKENAVYENGYKLQHPTIVEFWEILEEFDLVMKKKFLAFLTGTHKIPIHGMKSVKIKISKHPNGKKDEDRLLPVAQTCFDKLILPTYKKGAMKERLEFALNNCSTGFGLA